MLVAFNSFSLGLARHHSSGRQEFFSVKALQTLRVFSFPPRQRGWLFSECDDGAVVHRVVEDRERGQKRNPSVRVNRDGAQTEIPSAQHCASMRLAAETVKIKIASPERAR